MIAFAFPALRRLGILTLFYCALAIRAFSYDPDSGSMATTSSTAVQHPTIVHIHLSGTMNEIPIDDPFGLSGAVGPSLLDLLDTLKAAAADKDVRAVALTFDGMHLGLAQIDELRAALQELKDAGKPVWVYLGSLETKDYALFSIASRVSMAPHAELWLTGLYGEQVYLKGLLDKLGLQADVVHVGAYKAAGEIFTRSEPSPEANDNMNWLLDGMFDSIVADIAQARALKPGEVKALVDKAPFTAPQALEAGLIDAVEQREAFIAALKETFGDQVKIDNAYEEEPKPQVNLKSPFAFFSLLKELSRPEENDGAARVAVVYIDGEIADGTSSPDLFGRQQGAFAGNLAHTLNKVVNDPQIHAVVLRIDSPGGSAEASETILQAALNVRESGKPLIVSMGNTAASGGYYVACAADAIFADAKTLTGSIGVIGGKLVTTGLWTQLGVNWVGYRRGANAGIFSTSAPFAPGERGKIEETMNATYAMFAAHVQHAREGKLKKPLEDLAGGRVYTGRQALELGLVDTIGGLDALDDAAERAGLGEDYEVQVLPEPQDFITSLMQEISQEGEDPTDLVTAGAIPGAADAGVGQDFKAGAGSPLLEAALPYLSGLDPIRTHAAVNALRALELINRPGAALIMPGEFLIH